MSSITYKEQSYQREEQESVLDCLTAHGAAVPSSCRAGVCQTCLMRAVKGRVPEAAQTGLKATLAAQNYFLACVCRPEEDIEVMLPEEGVGKFSATVMEIKPLNAEIVCLQLRPGAKLSCKAGQYINLYKDEGTARSYSLASVPELDEYLQLHIRKVPQGVVSGWVHETLQAGDMVEISDVAGDCFYVSGNPDQAMLLIGTGSGLAPLYGIIRDALLQGHRGAIKLYHGSYVADGLYLVEELKALSSRYPNFSYTPCISEGGAVQGYAAGMVLDVALGETPRLSGWRVFLCGNPDMVENGKRQVFFAGASMREILTDSFLPANP